MSNQCFRSALSVFVLSIAFVTVGCLKPKKPTLKSDAGIEIPPAATDIGVPDDLLLDTFSQKNLKRKAKPNQLVMLVKKNWREQLPLRRKSGSYKKLEADAAVSDVTAIGDVGVESIAVAKHGMSLRSKTTSVPSDFEVVKLELQSSGAADLIKSIRSLHSLQSVVLAEPNFEVKAIGTPNDPSFPSLWGMQKISATQAWDTWTGAQDFTVAVIDTGIDYNHEDLKDNIWTNTKEIPGNNIDDDGNGYVDDVKGWNFYWANNDPMDGNGHGTHCAGTVAGRGNNGVGVAGVSWNARLMPVKVLSDSGSGYNFDIYDGIMYAVNNGARVTSNSYGGGGASALMATAISQAQSKGVLFIAAAGNESTASASYPSYYSKTYDNVLSIASTDSNDALSSFSNYGDGVNIAAPGGNILSTVPNNGYQSYSGTSMATPHVAGLATLIWSKNPNLSYTEVKDAILSTGDTLAALSGKVSTGSRINAKNALDKVSAAPTPVPTTPAPTPVPTTPAPTPVPTTPAPTPVPTTPAPTPVPTTPAPTPVPTTPAPTPTVAPTPTPTPGYQTGIRYSYFTTPVAWTDVPTFDRMASVKEGVVSSFSLAPRTQSTKYGFSYKGFIKVDRAGTYTFYTSSDDGSYLWINGMRLVNNGGVHTRIERSGFMTLPVGYHEIRVDYFQATSKQGLTVKYKGPGIKKQVIPSTVLFHE